MTRLIPASRLSIVVVATTLAVSLTGCIPWTTDRREQDHLEAARKAQRAGQLDIARLRAQAAVEAGDHAAQGREILADVFRRRADAAFEDGLFRRAHESYLEAADYEPAAVRRAGDLENAFVAARRFGLAADRLYELVERVLEYRPDDAELRREAARLAEDAADYERAGDHYLWLYSAGVAETTEILRLGIAYLATDRPGDAVSVLEPTWREAPDNTQIAVNLARAYIRLGRHDDALDLYDDLVERFPDHPGILHRYARLHQQLGNAEEARRLRERAAEASPGGDDREMRPLR